MILDELGQYLVDNGLGQLKGQATSRTIWLGTHSDEPDDIITLLEYQGGAPEYTQGKLSAELVQIQVLARGVHYEEVRDRIDKVWKLFVPPNPVANFTIGSTRYQSIFPNSSPALLNPDRNNRFQLAFNMTVKREVN